MTANKNTTATPLEIETLILKALSEGATAKPRRFQAHGTSRSAPHQGRNTNPGLFSQAGRDNRKGRPIAMLARSLLTHLADPYLSWEPIHPLHLIT